VKKVTEKKIVKINIRCTPDERARFKAKAASEGMSASQIMRRLMLEFTRGKIRFTAERDTS